MERSLSMELVRVTEGAALASARWMGRGLKDEADDAATSAMRDVFDTVPMKGTVVTDSEGRILWVPGLRKSVYDTGEGHEDSLVLQVKSNHLLGGS